MAKIVFRKSEDATARQRGSKPTALKVKRIRTEDGRTTTLRVLSSESHSFGDDFNRAFGANVKKARAENKRVTGAADRVPDKR
jgi:hypothetical protein